MRTHFLAPAQIAGLFRFPGARIRVERDGATFWVLVGKHGSASDMRRIGQIDEEHM